MTIELQDKLYTSTQVADILGVSLRTLYRYMEDGRIKSMRTASGRHRFTKDQIVEFLNAGNMDLYDEESFDTQKNPEPQNNNITNRFVGSNVPPQSANSFYNIPQSDYAPASQGQAPRYPEQDQYRQEQSQSISPQSSQQDKPLNQPTVSQEDSFFYAQGRTSYDSIDDFDFTAVQSSKTVIEEDPKIGREEVTETEFDAFEFKESDVKKPDRYEGDSVFKQTFGYNEPVRQSLQNLNPQSQYTPLVQQSQPQSNYAINQPQTSDISRAKSEPTDVFDLSYSNLNVRYYKSDYSDLIDLARRIKETGKSRDLEYAFTLYAGLSLHFLIKPFTILHFYANPEDMQIWKEDLNLTPANRKEDANVGVIVNTDIVFVPTKEIASFKVVEDKVLLRDLSEAREDDLIKQFRQNLMSS